ncbi:ferredoxin--NADP reductase [Allopusillimonas ginsengisoli]|uniref:ferredoxin--NADP reductase n=1 Tax=Allopusillimonas ginsengisoli TaxID=453575 RepID=UPI00101FA0B4|nr:FAD-dependent oxidoreductase [Allopusillimonas ginsengisoli]TEA74132.1 FAD-dependent oxidoreductase [Allopusillimonas ginsengisoli]
MLDWTSRLLEVEWLALDAVRVHFERPDAFSFMPGQTISLLLPTDHASSPPLRHIFSLAGAPHEPALSIATRVREHSAFKQKLIGLKEGATLHFTGPFGYFSPPRGDARPIVLIAGGIGIAPCFSIAKHLAHTHDPRDCLLLYSCRDPESAALLTELEDCASRNPQMRLHVTMTSATVTASAWRGLRGRFGQNLLGVLLDGALDADYYVAGPAAMVDSVSKALAALGVDGARIAHERFFAYGDVAYGSAVIHGVPR